MMARNIQSDLRRVLAFTSTSYAGMRKLSLRYNLGLRESGKSLRPLGPQCYICVEYLSMTSRFMLKYLYLVTLAILLRPIYRSLSRKEIFIIQNLLILNCKAQLIICRYNNVKNEMLCDNMWAFICQWY